ncbi:MAG: glycoside hydrolase family 3 N-terminal domain-containing protein [Candidatus Melainabacteria bacterium]|nr:glycoside hydrolase family 3 N-terminal domain-containing protein [Candidatus Melainabacteria bacterium]
MQLSNLFICGFKGATLDKETASKLLELKPAGLILFDTNIEEPEQLKKLITDLKDLLGEDILISVDQEGGKVERLRKVSASLPSLYALGTASRKNPDYLNSHTQLFASELIDLGFNLVFAPCLDLNTNPLNPIIGTRSLGNDAKLVSEQATAIISELKKHPLLNCAKHFPGHGDSSKDSHYSLPYIDLSEESSFNNHLEPFRAAINSEIDMVMTAHAIYKLPESIQKKLLGNTSHHNKVTQEILEKLPASINPFFVEGLLQQELKFKGLCVTDEITMKALSAFGDYKRICELMIKAGNDLIIWNTNLDEALEIERSSPTCHFSKSLRERIENSIEKIKLTKNQLKTKKITVLESQHSSNLDKNSTIKHTLGASHREKLIQEMSNIVQDSIQIKYKAQNGLNAELSSLLPLKPDYILVFEHPKLESEVIMKVFPEAKLIKFSAGTESLIDLILGHLEKELNEILKSTLKYLILTFQCWSDPKLENLIKDGATQLSLILNFKKHFPNTVHVECDFDSEIADINLAGANFVHYKALTKILTLL